MSQGTDSQQLAQARPMPAGYRAVPALRVLGVVVALVTVLVAAASVAAGLSRTRTSDSFTVADVETVEVVVGTGRVELTRTTGGEVRVDVTSTTWGQSVGVARAVNDGVLRLSEQCRNQLWGGCTTDFSIAVPAGTVVEVTSGTGQITGEGLDGPLTLRSSTGEIDMSELASQDVRATASVGRVALDFAVPPRRVDARASTGEVSVVVPDDGTAYDVSASSSVGDDRVDVPRSSTSPRIIEASASVGDVQVLLGDEPDSR